MTINRAHESWMRLYLQIPEGRTLKELRAACKWADDHILKYEMLVDGLRELAESWLPDIRTDSEGNLKRMNRVMTGTMCANELRALLGDDDD